MIQIAKGCSKALGMAPLIRAWGCVPLVLAIACATAQPAGKPTMTTGTATPVTEAPRPTQLVPFHGRDGFTVLMPPKPYESERTESTPGGPVYVHLTQARSETAKYLASVSEFPKGSLDRTPSKELLDSLQQSTLQSMDGKLVSAREIEVGGLPGREFTATDPEGSEVTARLLVGDSRVYTVAGTYPKGVIPESILRFLDSFHPPPGTAPGTGRSVEPTPAPH